MEDGERVTKASSPSPRAARHDLIPGRAGRDRRCVEDGVSDASLKLDAIRHKLIADLFELPIWYREGKRYVTPKWGLLTIEERDLIADALKQWKTLQ